MHVEKREDIVYIPGVVYRNVGWYPALTFLSVCLHSIYSTLYSLRSILRLLLCSLGSILYSALLSALWSLYSTLTLTAITPTLSRLSQKLTKKKKLVNYLRGLHIP